MKRTGPVFRRHFVLAEILAEVIEARPGRGAETYAFGGPKRWEAKG